MRKHLAQTVLACFFVYIVWGTTYPAIRLMLAPPGGEGLPLFFATGGRLLIAGIALLIVGQFSRQGRFATRHLTRTQVSSATCSGLFLSFGTAALVATAAQRLPAGAVASYMATAPIWAVLMTSAVTRSLPRMRVTIGLLLGFSGVITLTGSTASSDLTGVICALAGAVIWAFGSWYTSFTRNFPTHIWISGGIGQLTSGIALICVAMFRSEPIHLPLPHASTASLLAFAYLAGVSLAGLTAYSWLLKNRNPLVATTHAFINPLVAAGAGALVLSEGLTLRLLLSAGMVGIGALLAMTTVRMPRRPLKS